MFTILAYRDKIVTGTVAEAVQISKANVNLFESWVQNCPCTHLEDVRLHAERPCP